MSRLKVSYQKEQELKNFMELLPEQSVLSVKVPKKQNGSCTRAYINLDMAADKEEQQKGTAAMNANSCSSWDCTEQPPGSGVLLL